MNTEEPSSSAPSQCPNCGSLLPAHAPQGLCPKCLFTGLGAETLDDGAAPVRPPVPTPEELAPHFPQLEILGCLGRGGMVLMFTTVPLGFAAPFATTILGWMAVSDIRRSQGRLHGMWLALFDGLVFPMIALAAIVGWFLVVAVSRRYPRRAAREAAGAVGD